MEKLTKGTIPLKWLREWFIEKFPEKSFDEIIETLEDRHFIFINQIGLVEKYVLLVKEVNAERIPPDSVTEYIDDKPELIELLLPKVQKYFSEYEMSAKMKNTILIVDDDPKILNLTEKFLKLGDFNTITCSNAKEALKVIEERYNDIAMILLNPMMPGLNKYEFLQSVNSDERYKHILVMFLIGKALVEPLQMQKTDKSIERIKSLMREKSVNKLTIERKYLPEIFSTDILDISKDGGLPILKPFVIEYFRSKGIITEFYGNVIKFIKQQELNCKFCGNRLVKEQKICPACGKMVI